MNTIQFRFHIPRLLQLVGKICYRGGVAGHLPLRDRYVSVVRASDGRNVTHVVVIVIGKKPLCGGIYF
jgi:hypothetical protein